MKTFDFHNSEPLFQEYIESLGTTQLGRRGYPFRVSTGFFIVLFFIVSIVLNYTSLGLHG